MSRLTAGPRPEDLSQKANQRDGHDGRFQSEGRVSIIESTWSPGRVLVENKRTEQSDGRLESSRTDDV